MKGKYNMNTKQNLFTEEELAKVTDEAARFVAIRGHETGTIFEVELEERKVVEAHDHNEAFFGCKAYMYMDDIPTQKIVKISRYSTEQEDDKE